MSGNIRRAVLDVAASMPNPAALPRRFEKIIAAKGFRVWKPTIKADTSGALICEDSDDDAVYSKAIPLTDGKHHQEGHQ
jgi:hypothetical protein